MTRLERAAQAVIDAAARADTLGLYRRIQELAAAMPRTKRRPPKPSKVDRRERKDRRIDSDAKVRAIVMHRAAGRCECCGAEGMPLEHDHFWGRARDRSVEGSWALCGDTWHAGILNPGVTG